MLSRQALAAVVFCALALPAVAFGAGNAFGVNFGEPVPDYLIAEPIAATVPTPPPGTDYQPRQTPAHLAPRWHRLDTTVVPRVLDAFSIRFAVQLGDQGGPLRIVAQIDPKGRCMALAADVAGILNEKYEQADSAPSRAGYSGNRRFLSGARPIDRPIDRPMNRRINLQIDLQCRADGGLLLLEYTDRTAFAAWHSTWQTEIDQWEADETRARNLALAEAATAGTQALLESAFGVQLREPFTEVPGFLPDVPLPVTRPGLKPPFDDAHIELVLDPEGNPIAIHGAMTAASEAAADALLDELTQAFKEKYGTPMKSRPRHWIFNVGGDYLVVKIPEEKRVEVRVIRQAALQAQRLRQKEALARAEADSNRQRSQETRGL